MATDTYRKLFLGVLVIGVTIAFVLVMRKFLMTLLLAAIFSALLVPLNKRMLKLTRGRLRLASVTTLVLVVLLIVVPLTFFVGVLVSQAVSITQGAHPWIESQLQQPDALEHWLSRLPMHERILPYRDEILVWLGNLTHNIGGYVVGTLSSATRGTLTFLLQLFIMLYAMYFFLVDGPRMLSRIGTYLPLSGDERGQIMGRFVTVTRAALMSTLVIGVIQGTLAGIAMAIAGIPGSVFWGTTMAVLSMIPGVGAALVWVPAGIYLVATDRLVAAMFFLAFCAVVVGSVDNILRPRIVGKDTRLPELVVLLSTLGGIMLMGAVGVIIGPVVAALFITVWDIYAAAMRGPGARAR